MLHDYAISEYYRNFDSFMFRSLENFTKFREIIFTKIGADLYLFMKFYIISTQSTLYNKKFVGTKLLYIIDRSISYLIRLLIFIKH